MADPMLDSAVAAVLAAQSGVVTARDFIRLDVDPRFVREWVRVGLLVRVRRGAFVDSTVWAAAGSDEQYRLRVQAVLRSRTAKEYATHHSAVALHGLPLWHVPRDLVVVAADVEESTTVSGLRVMPTRGLVDEVELDGLRVLSIPDAVVTTSSVSTAAGVVAGDAALQSGACSVEELEEAAERLGPSLRGKRRLRNAVAALDPKCESVGESRTRLILAALGLPFDSQVPIRDVDGHLVGRVDFLVAGRVIVEFDGAVKYGGEDGREVLIAEKRREDRLRELGYAVVRITWDELADPATLLSRIRAALSRLAA
ncbi:type IV toxin-antitoxin system AbiEi family antitoxin domain-containing protein [Knoellia koreensis]|uniref:Type IV toxin-antitoxin system AbiEi family antitoxin domain-containing protein n=1 Tax=Knoellia koreensis TaxID=2730921 RepID=A0A849HHY7_9MICO|nr:type IV toxin-antitoxin system AbiEi family antitoxin domain-containing protein [Knoellia sp. DB2414S]NNM46812.1 type IV toxin-antitoxin system AbiEi family antitoxin domain-containing protein [Knoellia sp. DB2414S]